MDGASLVYTVDDVEFGGAGGVVAVAPVFFAGAGVGFEGGKSLPPTLEVGDAVEECGAQLVCQAGVAFVALVCG